MSLPTKLALQSCSSPPKWGEYQFEKKSYNKLHPTGYFISSWHFLTKARDFLVSQFTIAPTSSELHFSIFLPRGRFTMKLIKLKLWGPFQGPGRGPSNVFTWSYIFVKFAKLKCFNHNRFSLLSLSTPTSHLSQFPLSQVAMEWQQACLQYG
jgi:hypothetical protein